MAHAERSVVGLECRGHFVLPEITRTQVRMCALRKSPLEFSYSHAVGEVSRTGPVRENNHPHHKAATNTAVPHAHRRSWHDDVERP